MFLIYRKVNEKFAEETLKALRGMEKVTLIYCLQSDLWVKFVVKLMLIFFFYFRGVTCNIRMNKGARSIPFCGIFPQGVGGISKKIIPSGTEDIACDENVFLCDRC